MPRKFMFMLCKLKTKRQRQKKFKKKLNNKDKRILEAKQQRQNNTGVLQL